MSAATSLPLRDVHLPTAPGLWPPPLGWWLVLAAVLLIAIAGAWWWRRRRRRGPVVDWGRVFDAEVAAATTASAQIAAMSVLLRRAARQREPAAATLTGSAWLAWLDGSEPGRFSGGVGQRLLDDAWRAQTEADIGGLHALARARFVELMAATR